MPRTREPCSDTALCIARLGDVSPSACSPPLISHECDELCSKGLLLGEGIGPKAQILSYSGLKEQESSGLGSTAGVLCDITAAEFAPRPRGNTLQAGTLHMWEAPALALFPNRSQPHPALENGDGQLAKAAVLSHRASARLRCVPAPLGLGRAPGA